MPRTLASRLRATVERSKGYGLYRKYEHKSFGREHSPSAKPQIAGMLLVTSRPETRLDIATTKRYGHAFMFNGQWHYRLKYRQGVKHDIPSGVTASNRNSVVRDGKLARMKRPYRIAK